MKSDPRKAYLAVKRSVYKMLLGGNVSILAKRKASSTRVKLNLERKVDANPNMRGGNRRKRSSRTEQIDSYYGSDRGFILRFVNAGTSDRKTKYGRRGRISARNWFGDASVKSLNEAAEEFVKLIEKEVNNITHNGK